MGSHLMHLVIANEVLPHLPSVDRTQFLFGNLAPDATTNKAGSHYYAGRHDDLTRRLDLEQYWSDSEGEPLSYRLGYYCHLVADEIWLQGFYKGWLKQLITADPSKQAAYYADFDTYNATLAERLGHFSFQSLRHDVDEAMNALIQKIERDTKMKSDGRYTMFLPHQFDGYVDTCVERCRRMVEAKLGIEG